MVTAGRATIVTPTDAAAVGPGAVIFVPAGEELVVFGPAYGSRR